MIAIKIEYECESVSIALYEGIEVQELTEAITSSLRVNGTVLGLKDSSGVVLLLKYICRNVAEMQPITYELIVKPKDGRLARSPAQRKADPNKMSQRPLVSMTDQGSDTGSMYPAAPRPPTSERADKRQPEPGESELLQLTHCLRQDGFVSEAEERAIHDMVHAFNHELIYAYHAFLQ
jgi:hypothetical protein